jgi:adenosylmethionine-8-amino-7-oxononanoate aminotransferase
MTAMPGSEDRSILELDRAHVWHPLLQHRLLDERPLTAFTHAKGCTVVDHAGREYLDGMAGLFCVNAGYGRDEIADAVVRQMKRLPYYPLTQVHEPAARLGEKLAAILPPELERMFFVTSGSEAVETALKMARQAARQIHRGQNRYKIIARYRGYHGFTMGAASATGQLLRRRAFEPLVPGFHHVRPPYRFRCPYCQAAPECTLACADEIESTIRYEGPESVAAVIAEPVIGGGGVIVSPEGYLPRVREICDRYGVLLILDEVITAFGRLGSPFGCQAFGVVPDIMTVAKAITSAYLPLAAAIATRRVFEAFLGAPEEGVHFDQVSTFGGHPASCAAALANLDIFTRERLWEKAAAVGPYLMERLRAIRHPLIGEVRGKGLLLGVELVTDEKRTPAPDAVMVKILAGIKERGVLAGRNAETVPGLMNILMFAPPLVLSRPEADRIADAVEGALRAAA